MRPDVNRAIDWQKTVELAADDGAWNKEGQRANHPVEVSAYTCALGGLHNRGIGNEEDNRNEDDEHIYA